METAELRLSHHLDLIPVLFSLAVCTTQLSGQQPGAKNRVAPPLATAHEVHSLTVEQATQGRPVHLQGVVTYFDPNNDPWRPALFASDSTGGVYVDLRLLRSAPYKAGDAVDIKGRSASGGYAPIVIASEVKITGTSPLPVDAPRVTLTRILTGSVDGRWVEVEGVVRAVRKSKANVDLFLALGDGEIMAATPRQEGVEFDSLIDAKVLLRGNAAPLFNGHGQMNGFFIQFPNREQITVEEPAPLDPFASPVSPIADLLRYTPVPSSHRTHTRGTVTLYWPGRVLCIQNGDRGLCAQTGQTTPLSVGEEADVIGFPLIGTFASILVDSNYRQVGRQSLVTPRVVTATEALRGTHDAELIELQGQFIGQDDFASDPNLVLSSQNHVFSAVLPRQGGAQSLPAWEKGTTLKIVGICSVNNRSGLSSTAGGDFSIPESFRVLLRSPADVTVIHSPSWWTPMHAVIISGVAVLSAFGILLWVAVLRKRVREQTRTIREQLAAEERSQQALESQTLTLQAVLDSMQEGLVAADENGKFIIWNPAATRILGRGSADLPPDEWSMRFGFHLPDGVTPVPPGQTPLARAMRGEVVATELIVRNDALAGDVWVEASSSPLKDTDGSVRGGMVAFRDVTRRKADEREIRELNESLEARIARRTSALEIANRDLEAFSYSVSHNLRTPTRHVASYTRIILEEFGAAVPMEARVYLRRVEEATRRIVKLSDALLTLTKIGRQIPKLATTELNPVVHRVIVALEEERNGRNVQWKVAPLPPIVCDTILVRTVFESLLGNSLKFTGDREDAVIEVDSTERLDRPTILFVRDNGVGFDIRYGGKLFEMFQRLHTEDEFEGIGVGLAIAHRIVTKHGGTIWAEAEVDRGATFYFTLEPDRQKATYSVDDAKLVGTKAALKL